MTIEIWKGVPHITKAVTLIPRQTVLLVLIQSNVSLNININSSASVPIYRQIVEQVRLAAATGKVAIGDQLPSIRALAKILALNPNTVARAYADLARDGSIETRPGRGVFIIRKRKVLFREGGKRRLEPLLNSLISEAMALDFSFSELQALFEKQLSEWKLKKEAG